MSAEVIIYGTRYCSYCVRARMLLANKGVRFGDIDVGHGEQRDALEQRVGKRQVPQISINGRFIGGYYELSLLDRSGQLDTLLSEPPPQPTP